MKCPEELTRDDLWKILGEYAFIVGQQNGVIFSDNVHVEKAFDEYYHLTVDKLYGQTLEDPAANKYRMLF